MVKVKRFTQHPLNEDAIFGDQIKTGAPSLDNLVKDPKQTKVYSPFAALNDENVNTVVGPDGKTYNIDAIRENTRFIYRMIVKEYPQLSYFMSLLKPVFTFDVPTMATDGYHIFISPYFFVHLHSIKPYLAPTYVIMHELYHNLLSHFKREHESGGQFPNHGKCNIAQDIEINTRLEKQNPEDFAGLTELCGGVIDWKYEGMLWEDIYPLLPEDANMPNQPNPSGGQQQQNQQGQGQQQQQSQGSGSGQGQPSQQQGSQQGQGSGEGDDQQQPKDGDKLSGGVPDTNEQGKYSDMLSKEEGKKIAERAGVPYTDEMLNSDPKQIWDKAINGHADSLKNMPSTGNPGTGLYETIKKIQERYKPTQNWKKELERFMNDAFMEEDVKFPQKKYIGYDRYKRYEDEVEDGLREVCILFDASGSVMGTQGAHEQFISEIDTIFKRTKIQEGTICYFADGVPEKYIVKFRRKLPSDAFEIKISGGTDYNAALAFANNYYKKSLPGVVLLMTDDDVMGSNITQHFKWMDKKLIWFVVSGNPKEIHKAIPFGKVLAVDRRTLGLEK